MRNVHPGCIYNVYGQADWMKLNRFSHNIAKYCPSCVVGRNMIMSSCMVITRPIPWQS